MIIPAEHEAAALIAKYIEAPDARDTEAEAIVVERSVPVWALISRFLLTSGDDAAESVAAAYDISNEAMQAAIAYYREHKRAIDARLAALDAV